MKTKEENFNLEVRKIINREFYKRGNQSVCESVSDFITDLFNKHSDQQNSDLLKQIDELKKENEKIKSLFEGNDPIEFMRLIKKHSSFEMILENLLLQSQLSESNTRVKELEDGFKQIFDSAMTWVSGDFEKGLFIELYNKLLKYPNQ